MLDQKKLVLFMIIDKCGTEINCVWGYLNYSIPLRKEL